MQNSNERNLNAFLGLLNNSNAENRIGIGGNSILNINALKQISLIYQLQKIQNLTKLQNFVKGPENNIQVANPHNETPLSNKNDSDLKFANELLLKKTKLEKQEEEQSPVTNTASNSEETNFKLKLYKCTFKGCEKIFPKEANLVDHDRTHSGDKPFQCPTCNKLFSQLGNLKKTPDTTWWRENFQL